VILKNRQIICYDLFELDKSFNQICSKFYTIIDCSNAITMQDKLLAMSINDTIIIDKDKFNSHAHALYLVRKMKYGTWIRKTVKSKILIIRMK